MEKDHPSPNSAASEEANALHGAVTLPAETGAEDTVRRLLRSWKADAIRDSDGTRLSPELKKLDLQIYSTICLVRADQEYPVTHPEHLPQKYLLSEPVHAGGPQVQVELLKGFHREKYRVDETHDPHQWWEVIDRTTGARISPENWSFDAASGTVAIHNCQPYHRYTVSFLVWLIWDTTSMYNHLTNGWTCDHVVSIDPYHNECRKHLMAYFDRWLEQHPETDVVRLTTLAYHFGVDNLDHEQPLDRFRDWTGYQDTVSIPALLDFEKEYGYRLRPEDFVDEGFHNHSSRVPSQAYRDWMDFIHRFVVDFGRELTDKIHAAGRKAAIFWGDHWVGVEPYSPHFQQMGIDIHVGAAEDGVALRRVSDAPGPQLKELRLYPYFFPDVFAEGGDPVKESRENWIKIRRALLREPVDRIGYGGYLSLAAEFPDFVEHVEDLCHEFRRIQACAGKGPSWKAPVKVAVLNAWGPLRAWINSFGVPQKFLEKRVDVIAVAGTNLLECLAGLPLEVTWLSFDQIAQNGVPEDVDVIINDGDAGTSWSGGDWWAEPSILSSIRRFVAEGGGFLGCRGPSACFRQGNFFQLNDVMGVERETGFAVQSPPAAPAETTPHPITSGLENLLDFGPKDSNIHVVDPKTFVLAAGEGHVHAAAHSFGKGRSVFFSALPYSLGNAEALYRSLLWAAGKDSQSSLFRCSNPLTDCAWYEQAQKWVVVNNSGEKQVTTLQSPRGSWEMELLPWEVRFPTSPDS